MNFQEIVKRLHSTLDGCGVKMSMVSAGHVAELRRTVENDLHRGLIDKGVYRQNSAYFDSMLTEDCSWARSILAVAAPSPVLEVVFSFNGEKRSTIIPPNYDESIDEKSTILIERELIPCGYRIQRAALPQKLLAARSGLARYGRNNIVYVEGMGSYHRLFAFYTDLPTVNDTWQGPRVLDECTGCNACTKKCPTKAIDPDLFRLHAERCLTYYNESSNAFPSWIDNSWHHCLIGCMKCQQFCPANKNVRSWIKRFAEFTENETALLMRGMAADQLPSSLTAKLDIPDLLANPRGLARNLKSVLASKG